MRRSRKAALVLASLAAALIGSELALRLWYPVGQPSYRLDALLLHEPIPGSRRIQPMPAHAGGARNLIALNEQGYRGPALEVPKRRPRLVVIGDSLVMAENVAYEESFPARLAQHLDQRYEVIGVGASGYGPDQALLRLERDFKLLQPDLVLLVLCATNDHGDLVRNKLYALERGGGLRRRRQQVGPDVVAHFERAASEGGDLALVRLVRAYRRSRAQEAQQAREAASEPEDYMSLYLTAAASEWTDFDGGSLVVHDLLRDYYDADLAIDPEAPSAVGKRALMAGMMKQWARSLRDRRTTLRAVILPSAVDLDPTFRIRVDRERFAEYDPMAQTRSMLSSLDAAGVEAMDLFELFSQNDPAQLFVGRDDIHWNARGIELAAKTVAAWLDED